MIFSNTPPGEPEGRSTDPPLPGMLLPLALTTLPVVAALWLMIAVTGLAMVALPLVLLWGGLGMTLLVLAREMSGDVDYANDQAAGQSQSGATVIAHPARHAGRAASQQRSAA